MSKSIRRYEITDEEWERIKDMLPKERTGKAGRPVKMDNRTSLNGMLWIVKSGAPWRDLPERYGSWSTLYDKYAKWSNLGIFESIFKELSLDADLQDISIDSTVVRVHSQGTGAKKGL